ncbi:MAG TPA: SGNH/GDSL hydrolase family protein [Pirellulales bacterium]
MGLSVLLALLACEVGLRVAGYSPTYINPMGSFHDADPVCGHRGRPNIDVRFASKEFDVRIVHDAIGFRRLESPRPSASDARRVCVFGDSFVWGWGVEQGECYADQLQARLRDRRIENFGVNNVGTVAEYELFASECRDRLKPGDVVLLTFCTNDFLDNVTGSRHAEVRDGQVVLLPANSHLRPSWKRTCQQGSYLFNYLSFVINRYQLERRYRRESQQTNVASLASAAQEHAAQAANVSPPESSHQPAPTAATVAVQAPPAQAAAAPAAEVAKSPVAAAETTKPKSDLEAQVIVTRHFLEKWKRDCEDRGARFIVAYIPGMIELTESPFASIEILVQNQKSYREAFFACAESLQIETLDLLPGMLAAKREKRLDRLAYPHDTHWTATGHRVVADIVAQRLEDTTVAAR